MLVESKYFQCEKCGEHSICLIFAPQAETAIQLIGLKPRKPQNVAQGLSIFYHYCIPDR